MVGVELLWLVHQFGGQQVTSDVDGLSALAATLLAAGTTWRRSRLPTDRSEQLGWRLLALAMALFAAGLLISIYDVVLLQNTYRFPSLADVPYQLSLVAEIMAAAFIGGQVMRASRFRVLMDGGIVAGAVLLLTWLTALAALFRAEGSDPLRLAVSLTYPIGNVIQIAIVVSTVSHTRRLSPSLLLVAAALLSFAVSASVFAAQGGGHPNPLDAGELAGCLLLVAASRARGPGPAPPVEPPPAPWQIVLPYLPLTLASVVALLGPLDPVARVLSGAVIALVVARQVTALFEARSLAGRLTSTSREQQILIDQAPVGIARLNAADRIVTANRLLGDMLGRSPDSLTGRSLLDFVHPEDRPLAERNLARRLSGFDDGGPTSVRAVRSDHSIVWCAARVRALRDISGRVERSVAILEDITDEKLQTERAARIQRGLLPKAALEMEGYELAGACRPALDVAGDFYDWLPAPNGHVDLTVADVMGKGMGSALLMAALRTALRVARPELGPAVRLRTAADSIGPGITDDGVFVTLFHARLDCSSGRLVYVDAGHGYCAVRRRDGELLRLPARSLPLGVMDEGFAEGTVQLDPGDLLLIYSDGLVEREDGTVTLDEVARWIDGSVTAAEAVTRLMSTSPELPPDDITVVILRRT